MHRNTLIRACIGLCALLCGCASLEAQRIGSEHPNPPLPLPPTYTGEWFYRNARGELTEAQVVDGKYHGAYRCRKRDGAEVYRATYREGMQHGPYFIIIQNDTFARFGLSRGLKLSGEYRNGDPYNGQFREGGCEPAEYLATYRRGIRVIKKEGEQGAAPKR